jgi:hypothetical protein
MTAFPDMELLMDDVRIEGDRAVYHWTFIGFQYWVGWQGASGSIQRFRGVEDRRGWTHCGVAGTFRQR